MASEFPSDGSTAADYAGFLSSIVVPVDLISSAVDIGELAFFLAQQLFGVPDPLDLVLQALAGRPTMQATIDQAQTLKGYQSPVLQLLATGAAILASNNIPISSPEAAPIFGQFFAAAVYLENAIRWRSQSANVGQLDALTLKQALTEAGNPGVAGNATLTAIESAWSAYSTNDPTYAAMQVIANWTYTDAGHALAEGVAKKFLAQNPPGAAAPPATVEIPSLPAPPGAPNVDGDEITDATYTLSLYLYFVAYTMNTMATGGNGNQSDCCDQMIAALLQIQTALSASATTSAGSGVSDLITQFLPAVNDIATALHNIRLALDTLPANVTDALCACIGNPLKQIADSLTGTGDLEPPPVFDFHAFINSLVQQGDFDPGLAQLITGQT